MKSRVDEPQIYPHNCLQMNNQNTHACPAWSHFPRKAALLLNPDFYPTRRHGKEQLVYQQGLAWEESMNQKIEQNEETEFQMLHVLLENEGNIMTL